MSHEALRSDFNDLIDPQAPVDRIGTGFGFTEGPVWHPLDHYLLFSDMPGDVRRRWDPEHGVAEVKRPANKCNGMTYDAGLNLIVCEHATSLLVRERPDGKREVLASHFGGKELNSPNDVCVRSDGSIYFTDPIYGRSPHYGVERPHELGFQGVYRVPGAGGAPQLLVDDDLFDQPNGLCFSPDEKLLYVNDSGRKLIRVFDVTADGALANGRIFASKIVSATEPGGPDGMKCDERGNVWVTAPGGLWVYAPSGDVIGKLRAPEPVANLAWGGARFPHPLSHREPVGLPGRDQGRAASRALHERQRRRRGDAAAASPEPAACSRPKALRAHHPGHAERRRQRGRRLRLIGRARARQGAERGREYPPPRRARTRERRAGDPCVVPRRARRARGQGQRAAVQGRGRAQGDGARDMGRGAGQGSSSPSPAISSSRR